MVKCQADDASGERSRAIASESALSAVFAPYLDHLELRDALRSLFDGALLACAPGWPRLLAHESRLRWLRTSDVLVELASAPARQGFELGLTLHAESATRLVDRLLGAPSSSGSASASGGPSEAECGLLAYAAARLCAASGRALLVRDVRRDPSSLSSDGEPLVLWPFALESSFGSLHAAVLLSLARAQHCALQAAVRLSLRDRLAHRSTVAALQIGDVLVSDEWSLTNTAEGLIGVGVLSAAGTETTFRAHLSGRDVRTGATLEPFADDQLELVIAERSLSLLELARLGAGEPLPFAPAAGERAQLVQAGRTLARGELVLHRGAVGLRVLEVFNDG